MAIYGTCSNNEALGSSQQATLKKARSLMTLSLPLTFYKPCGPRPTITLLCTAISTNWTNNFAFSSSFLVSPHGHHRHDLWCLGTLGLGCRLLRVGRPPLPSVPMLCLPMLVIAFRLQIGLGNSVGSESRRVSGNRVKEENKEFESRDRRVSVESPGVLLCEKDPTRTRKKHLC